MSYDPANFREEHLFRQPGIIGWLSGRRKRRVLEFVGAELARLQRPAHLLDIGCGYGDMLGELAGPDILAVGVDINCNALAEAASEVQQAHFLLGEVTRLPFPDGSFDAVICSEVLEHMPHPPDLIAEIERVTRPEGVYCLTVPNEWLTTLGRAMRGLRPWKSPAHLQAFTVRSFLRLFAQRPERFTLVPYAVLPFRLSTNLVALFRRRPAYTKAR